MLSASLPLLLAPPLLSSLSSLLSHLLGTSHPFRPLPLLFSHPFLAPPTPLPLSLFSFPSSFTTLTFSPTTTPPFAEGGRVTRASESVVPRLGRASAFGPQCDLPSTSAPTSSGPRKGWEEEEQAERGWGFWEAVRIAPHTKRYGFSPLSLLTPAPQMNIQSK